MQQRLIKSFSESLFSETFLRAHWAEDFRIFHGSLEDISLRERLEKWNQRLPQSEVKLQSSFIAVFFKAIFGYVGNGESDAAAGFTSTDQYVVPGGGPTGAHGQADLAIGWFNRRDVPDVPQGLCEFKDIRANLDAPQKRKGSNRSPVQQCADYLREASRNLYGSEPIQPTWGIVTDMNEFRLYWRNRMPLQYQRFVIDTTNYDNEVSLLEDSERGSFLRFCFKRMLSAQYLLSTGAGSLLLRLLRQQWIKERDIEDIFYLEYRQFRRFLYDTLRDCNPEFAGTQGQLIRLTQKLLDRLIFVLFCEDMGAALRYPPYLLRDFLLHYSQDPYYDEIGSYVWEWIRSLFKSMNEGTPLGKLSMNRFNGGLFAPDDLLDSLRLPNRVFCRRLQGHDAYQLNAHKDTLLYFSGTYNFGLTSGIEHAIGLYALGRIFEQSITELELLEADAEKRPSLTRITRRKLDGVYYTPEWTVKIIVDQTVGQKLRDVRSRILTGIDLSELSQAAVSEQKRRQASRRSSVYNRAINALRSYADAVDQITVLDIACGSGAFLIETLQLLLSERQSIARELELLTGEPSLFDEDAAVREILSRNVYGVDINLASVEITKLSLWLHTTRPDKPLSDLDMNILDGNSLIESDYYTNRQMELVADNEREIVKTFDWQKRLPQVFAKGGFDCIVSNPPYVKLQHFRKAYPQMADYLAGKSQAGRVYASTSTGNFDLFLPFIEKAITLIKPDGRIGMIAPSLWLFNEYGEALRRLIGEGKHLDRFIDFKSFQVFREAITYTALQFFTRTANDGIHLVQAPDGIVGSIDWQDPTMLVPYEELLKENTWWLLLPEVERSLIQRIYSGADRLGAPIVTDSIFQGLITGADAIYHLKRLGPNTYAAKKQPDIEVTLEDGIMVPIVSGTEAERYGDVQTDTYVLFPYGEYEGHWRLHTEAELKNLFPNAWRYLKQHEFELRKRDGAKLNDDQWYRFSRHQSISKQRVPKLIVPRLVDELYCTVDARGALAVDNVDVGGITANSVEQLYFISAVLNGPIAGYVFRRLSKPFQHEFRSANKQFIAPLPVPRVANSSAIADRARNLQHLHSEASHVESAISLRLSQCRRRAKPIDWMFPAVLSLRDLRRQAPSGLSRDDVNTWAIARRYSLVERAINSLRRFLYPGVEIREVDQDGAIGLSLDRRIVIKDVFVDDAEKGFILAQWGLIAKRLRRSRVLTPKRLVEALLKLAVTDNSVLQRQVVERYEQLRNLEAEIEAQEDAINGQLYEAYGLTPIDRQMIEMDGKRSQVATGTITFALTADQTDIGESAT